MMVLSVWWRLCRAGFWGEGWTVAECFELRERCRSARSVDRSCELKMEVKG